MAFMPCQNQKGASLNKVLPFSKPPNVVGKLPCPSNKFQMFFG
jgi:hypothetical protein